MAFGGSGYPTGVSMEGTFEAIDEEFQGKPYHVKFNLPPLAGVYFMKIKDEPAKKKPEAKAAKASDKKPAAKKTSAKKPAAVKKTAKTSKTKNKKNNSNPEVVKNG
jgi:1,4-alpha-glucan branching enzyme